MYAVDNLGHQGSVFKSSEKTKKGNQPIMRQLPFLMH